MVASAEEEFALLQHMRDGRVTYLGVYFLVCIARPAAAGQFSQLSVLGNREYRNEPRF